MPRKLSESMWATRWRSRRRVEKEYQPALKAFWDELRALEERHGIRLMLCYDYEIGWVFARLSAGRRHVDLGPAPDAIAHASAYRQWPFEDVITDMVEDPWNGTGTKPVSNNQPLR